MTRLCLHPLTTAADLKTGRCVSCRNADGREKSALNRFVWPKVINPTLSGRRNESLLASTRKRRAF